jgi:pyruvate dehydrogenase E2 component (dihydrolipoamide acetyltransferase)
MATNVILPALGMAQETGKIVQWLRNAGDQVAQGEPIAEIETDKVTVELEAPATGTLANLSASVGDEVPVGHVIAMILAPGEVPAPELAPVAAVTTKSDGHANGRALAAAPLEATAHADGHTRLASPKAKRIAAERGLDLAAIHGTGPNGVVVAADVLAASPATASVASVSVSPVGTGISTGWRVMAERTTQSWTTVPHFFLLREVEATALKQWHAQAQKRATEKLTYTDLLVKIVATALQQHPRVNASWQNGTIVTNAAINVGIAVAVADGLLVPVIAHADDLSLNAIARQRRDLVERAQAGKLRPEDLQGGTFTISNLGMYGVDAFNAIINAPQAAILAVGALADRVVARDGQPTVRPLLTLSLSCDHRVLDGARGAQFLATMADLLADPSGL